MDSTDSERPIRLYGETVPVENPESFPYRWEAGIAGGIAGGICMGAILHVGANIMPFIGALYGWPTVIGGWTAHIINSVLIGVLFAVLLSQPIMRKQTTSITGCLVCGIVYAAGVGLVTGGLMLPLSMAVIEAGTVSQPLFPVSDLLGRGLVAVSISVGHAVYGVVLGATYGAVYGMTQNQTEHEL